MLFMYNTFEGCQIIDGKLQAFGVLVQRRKIRKIVQAITGKEGASRRRIKRRQYSVRAPLSLIHIDGYMKLIR